LTRGASLRTEATMSRIAWVVAARCTLLVDRVASRFCAVQAASCPLSAVRTTNGLAASLSATQLAAPRTTPGRTTAVAAGQNVDATPLHNTAARLLPEAGLRCVDAG
jgi:hypothetical protein